MLSQKDLQISLLWASLLIIQMKGVSLCLSVQMKIDMGYLLEGNSIPAGCGNLRNLELDSISSKHSQSSTLSVAYSRST